MSASRAYRQLDSEIALLPVGADQELRCDPWTATATRQPGRCPGPPPHFRECVLESGGRFRYHCPWYWFSHRSPLSERIFHVVMEPVAISHIINLEGYTL